MKILKWILYVIARPFRLFWSNYYWKHIKKSRYDCPIAENEKIKKGETINSYIDRITNLIMDTFEYTHDGWEQLGDTTPPPPEIYAQFKDGEVWKDDCDGYHSCLYHFASQNNIECSLLSILSICNKYGHCVLGYKDEKGKYHIEDYRTNYTGDSYEDIIENHYLEVTGGALVHFEAKFNYDKNELYNISLSKHLIGDV